MKTSYSQAQMVQRNCLEEITESENPLRHGIQLVRSEELTADLRGSYRSQPTDEITDDGEARGDFCSVEGNYICRHHVEPRIQLHVPKEETLPNTLTTRTAHTTLDVLQESRTDDYWNMDVNRNLSESWTGFTKFTILNERPPKGYTWSGRRLNKSSSNYQT